LARWNFRTAIGTDHNIALSGGTDNVVYRASVDMLIWMVS
jgi:hypothetical protein